MTKPKMWKEMLLIIYDVLTIPSQKFPCNSIVRHLNEYLKVRK